MTTKQKVDAVSSQEGESAEVTNSTQMNQFNGNNEQNSLDMYENQSYSRIDPSGYKTCQEICEDNSNGVNVKNLLLEESQIEQQQDEQSVCFDNTVIQLTNSLIESQTEFSQIQTLRESPTSKDHPKKQNSFEETVTLKKTSDEDLVQIPTLLNDTLDKGQRKHMEEKQDGDVRNQQNICHIVKEASNRSHQQNNISIINNEIAQAVVLYDSSSTLLNQLQQGGSCQNKMNIAKKEDSGEIVKQNQSSYTYLNSQTISSIRTVNLCNSTSKNIQPSLQEILQYFPSKETNDSKNDNYFEKAEAVRKAIIKLWQIHNNLKNPKAQTNKLGSEFTYYQSQTIEMFETLIKVSYRINEEDFGEFFTQNQTNLKNLQSNKEQWEKYKTELDELNLIEHKTTLSQYFTKMYNWEPQNNHSDKLEQIKVEISALKQEQINQDQESNRNLLEFINTVSLFATSQALSEQNITQIEQLIKQQIAFRKKCTDEVESSFDEFSKNKKEILKLEREKIEKIKQERDKYLDNSQKLKQAKLDELDKQMESTKNMFQIGGDGHDPNLSMKKCFHYVVLLDVSYSFKGEAYDNAVKGLYSFVTSINQEDSLTVITFHYTATVKFPKQQKKNIDLINFENCIKECEGGCTSFMEAFNMFQKHITQTNADEYLVGLLITDGKDSTDLSSKISQILQNSPSLLFYTVGFGNQINTNQLKAITNSFNRCVDEQKTFQGKMHQLYYENTKPEQLYIDVHNLGQNRVTIQDIRDAQQFYKDQYQEQTELIDKEAEKREQQFFKEINYLQQNIFDLEKPCTKKSIEAMQDRCLQHFDSNLQDYMKQLSQEKSNVEKCSQQIRAAKQTLYNQLMQHYKDQDEPKTDKQFYDDFCPSKLHSKVSKHIKDQYQLKLIPLVQKLEEAEKQKYEALEKNFQQLSDYGFKDLQHFKKFNQAFDQIQNIASDIEGIINSYSDLIQQLILIGKMLKHKIDFTNSLIEKQIEKDEEDRVLYFYKQIIPNLNVSDKRNCYFQILYSYNTSILESCKENNIEKFYKDVVNKIKISDLFAIVDKKKSEQDNFIFTEYILAILNPVNLRKQRDNVNSIKTQIDETQNELETEQSEENEKQQDEQKLKLILELKKKIKDLKTTLKQSELAYRDEKYAFEEKNSLKISVISDIGMAFIKIIDYASKQEKERIIRQPFTEYLSILGCSLKYLKDYKKD